LEVDMDRSYLTHPKIVRCSWEGVVLYPILVVLSEEMKLTHDTIDPMYLSVVTRIPVSVVTDGVSALGAVGVLSEDDDCFVLTECSSHGRVGERACPAHALPPGGGEEAHARPPASVHPREGSLEAYLIDTWGSLVTRGKSLEKWVMSQEAAHPQLDLLTEAKKARAWEESQPKRKTAIRRFLANWFNRAEGFKEEILIRAEGGSRHWSGLSKRDRELALREGRHEHTVMVGGISLIRDLRDDMFVLSGQDLLRAHLPYRDKVKELVQFRLESSEDPHAPEAVVRMLKEMDARPEAPRALQWAMDQLVTDVRYDMGLLPV
jgi:hypothetical protein